MASIGYNPTGESLDYNNAGDNGITQTIPLTLNPLNMVVADSGQGYAPDLPASNADTATDYINNYPLDGYQTYDSNGNLITPDGVTPGIQGDTGTGSGTPDNMGLVAAGTPAAATADDITQGGIVDSVENFFAGLASKVQTEQQTILPTVNLSVNTIKYALIAASIFGVIYLVRELK